jgi:hypothetical protein
MHYRIALWGSAALALLAACGANKNTGPSFAANAASGATFSYPQPSSMDLGTQGSVNSALESVSALRTSQNVSVAADPTAFADVTSTLLGSDDVPTFVAADPGRQALTRGRNLAIRSALSPQDVAVDDANCLTQAGTSATFQSCTVTIDETNLHLVLTIDGSVTLDPTAGTGIWDLVVQADISSPDVQATVAEHSVGNFTATATTFDGAFENQFSVVATSQGTTNSLAVDESLTLDITFQGDPFCVTSGTLEAKRVWVTRPSGVPADELPDRGAQVTWNSCNDVNIALSMP